MAGRGGERGGARTFGFMCRGGELGHEEVRVRGSFSFFKNVCLVSLFVSVCRSVVRVVIICPASTHLHQRRMSPTHRGPAIPPKLAPGQWPCPAPAVLQC